MNPIAAALSAAFLVAAPALAQDLEIQGVVRPGRTLTVRAACDGSVAEVSVRLGDQVEAGAPLLQLDDRELRIAGDRAEARLQAAQIDAEQAEIDRRLAEFGIRGAEQRIAIENARIDARKGALEEKRQRLEQTIQLYDASRRTDDDVGAARSAVTQAEYEIAHAEAAVVDRQAAREATVLTVRRAELAIDRARAVVREREAELELVRIALDRTLLRAPFRGRVDRIVATPGQQVRAGETALAELVEVEEVCVEIRVPADDVATCAPGTRVVVSRGALEVEAEITARSATIAEGSGTMRAEIRLPNLEGQWIPGSSVRVRVRPQ